MTREERSKLRRQLRQQREEELGRQRTELSGVYAKVREAEREGTEPLEMKEGQCGCRRDRKLIPQAKQRAVRLC